jgi:hypothetical protein
MDRKVSLGVLFLCRDYLLDISMLLIFNLSLHTQALKPLRRSLRIYGLHYHHLLLHRCFRHYFRQQLRSVAQPQVILFKKHFIVFVSHGPFEFLNEFILNLTHLDGFLYFLIFYLSITTLTKDNLLRHVRNEVSLVIVNT